MSNVSLGDIRMIFEVDDVIVTFTCTYTAGSLVLAATVGEISVLQPVTSPHCPSPVPVAEPKTRVRHQVTCT